VDSIAFDATALIHFARAGRLSKLLAASADNEPVLLAEVAAELSRGARNRPSLDAASEARLKRADLEELAELAAFATYKAELAGRIELQGAINYKGSASARRTGGRYLLFIHSLGLMLAREHGLKNFGESLARRVPVDKYVQLL
jgi:hypothetical protein